MRITHQYLGNEECVKAGWLSEREEEAAGQGTRCGSRSGKELGLLSSFSADRRIQIHLRCDYLAVLGTYSGAQPGAGDTIHKDALPAIQGTGNAVK